MCSVYVYRSVTLSFSIVLIHVTQLLSPTPNDPEGALATVPTVMSAYLGTHFGRVVKVPFFSKEPGYADGRARYRSVLKHWTTFSAALMLLGIIIHYGGFPMNKQVQVHFTHSFIIIHYGAGLIYTAVRVSVWYYIHSH